MSVTSRTLGLLLAAIAAAGCKAGPNFVRPDVSVPCQWSHPLCEGLEADSPVNAAWWLEFNDPGLNLLVARALQDNLSLREASARIWEARAARGMARAGLFPDAYWDTSHTRVKVSNNGTAFGFNINRPPFNFWSSGWDASWEADVFGAVRRAIEAADGEIDAAIANRNAIMVTLLGDVAATYVQLRILQEQDQIARENAELQNKTVLIAESKLEEGNVSVLDVHQAKSSMYQTRAAVPALIREQDRAMNRLCVLQGRHAHYLMPEIGGRQPVPAAPNYVQLGIPVELIRRRPDIRRAESELAAQSARIGVATADLYPRFSITGVFSYDTTRFREWAVRDSIAYRLGPTIRWNVLSFGRIRNNIDIEDARYQQAAARYEQAVLQAVEEVENAISAFIHDKQQTAELEQAVQAAQAAAEVAELRYLEGATGFQSLLDAQRVLVIAENQYVLARGSVILSLIALYKALGGGWNWRVDPEASNAMSYPPPASAAPHEELESLPDPSGPTE